SAPFSALGHDAHVASEDATCMALPTNQPIDPSRNVGELLRIDTLEQPFPPIYSYAAITDEKEGRILMVVTTSPDGQLRNNVLGRALTWNENGVLDGARHITLGGYYAYIATPDALVILSLNNPLSPVLVKRIPLADVRASALQF